MNGYKSETLKGNLSIMPHKYQYLYDYYLANVFNCTVCLNNHTQILNPYLHKNHKISTEENKKLNHINRQQYFKDYIFGKSDIKFVFLGLAAGLDGCGYSGIPFTAESNAIQDLHICNYHKSSKPFQEEDSATLIYDSIKSAAKLYGVSKEELLKKLYFTNTCVCVPLKSPTNIKDPNANMRKKCSKRLVFEIDKIQPSAIIAFGRFAFYNLYRQIELIDTTGKKLKLNYKFKITDYIGKRFSYKNTIVIPELHPSPQNSYGDTKDLYQELPQKIIDHIGEFLF